MQSRVTFVKTGSPLDGMTGTVKGVASTGIVFTYSVLMDEPVWAEAITDYVDIVSITGSCLQRNSHPALSSVPKDEDTIMLMYHDDSCGELLDNQGKCPTCGFHPDGQSVGFVPVSMKLYNLAKTQGMTFLGRYREQM